MDSMTKHEQCLEGRHHLVVFDVITNEHQELLRTHKSYLLFVDGKQEKCLPGAETEPDTGKNIRCFASVLTH
jgi:hypothetical protein